MGEFNIKPPPAPTEADARMANRIEARIARVLNEFGFATAEQLADANHSVARNRKALAQTWKRRRRAISVQQRDDSGRLQEVFPLFQFRDHKPIKVVQSVLEAFGSQKDPGKLALWFTSNNGWLTERARPVDRLEPDPEAVVQAAQRDAGGTAA